METLRDTHDLAATLLGYPDRDYHDNVNRWRHALDRTCPEAGAALDTFQCGIHSLFTEELEELYTRTFDLNPACALEVGWHLFGENYSRGEFLVKMRGEMRRLGLNESTELPDHLAHVLAVLARLDPDQAEKFAGRFVLPALEKILAGLAGKDNPFANLLEAIRLMVAGHHAPLQEVNHD